MLFRSIDNRLRIVLDGGQAPTATVGQLIIEEQADQTVYAKIHEITQESGSYVIYCVDYTGDYNATFTAGAEVMIKDSLLDEAFETVTINSNNGSVTLGNYVPFSGDLLHFVDFDPIERQPDRKEKIKFVFDF